VGRCDGWRRRLASDLANRIRQAWLHDGVRDTCCSLKALRREHLKFLVPFDGMHRYIPAMLKNAGLTVAEVPVRHRPRRHGVSKYTLTRRAWRGLRDLLGVRWLLGRRRRFPAEVFAAPAAGPPKGLGK
jgi:dolichol-phosphate mannosyltransferase